MTRSHLYRHSFVLGMMLVTLVGCGPHIERFPVTGAVKKHGKPVKGGGLIFLPELPPERGLTVSGSVNTDGIFTTETLRMGKDGRIYVQPGTPAGVYRVIYHPPSDGSKAGLEVTLEERLTIVPPGAVLALTLPDLMPSGVGEPRDDNPNPSKKD